MKYGAFNHEGAGILWIRRSYRENKRVFWFITDFTGDTSNILNMTRADTTAGTSICKIIMKEPDGSLLPLVTGEFLNFSKVHLITGINLIEDLLFWTDNYNQPRKINITTAIEDNTYYNTEEKISVAIDKLTTSGDRLCKRIAKMCEVFMHNDQLGAPGGSPGSRPS